MPNVRGLLIALIAWCGVVCAVSGPGLSVEAPPGSGKPRLAIKLLDVRDKISHTVGRDGVRFEITAGGRAGRAEVTLTEGVWPADLTVRVHGACPPDFSLEADNGAVKLFGMLARDRTQSDEKRSVWTNPSVCWFDAKGQGLDKLSSRVKYVMTVAHTNDKGRVMEVVLPPHFCDKDVKVLRLHWINALE